MDAIAEAYIKLAHAIELHNPGYIDGYYGPEALKSTETRPLTELSRYAEQLGAAIATLDDPSRRAFLAAQVKAMQTSIALLQGEQIPYREEVRCLYDVEAAKAPEQQFDEAIAAIEQLLPGKGPIAAREHAFRAQFAIPPEQLRPLFDTIVTELRSRARDLIDLPESETFDVSLVNNQPWSGYNWYLGNNRSRIDINTDLPKYITDLPDLIAHEAYPGHHTEHALKDELLFGKEGRGEHAILLINAPECVVSEGIATRALRAVMSEEELRDWLKHDLAERAGLRGVDTDAMLDLQHAKRGMRNVTENAALLLHDEGASEEEVVAYLQRYRLATLQEARKLVEFITHPNFRSYTFTYTKGGELLDQLFAAGDMRSWFKRLLREPVTPGVLRTWIAEGASA